MVARMPQLQAEQPAVFLSMLNKDQNPGYILSAESYQVALSTGVLAHMATPEVSAYAYAAEAIRNYTALQTGAIMAESKAKAYVQAHPHPSTDGLGQELETLMLFAAPERAVASVCPQMRDDVSRAVRASEAR